MTKPETITIDDTKYIRADAVSAPPLPGKRAVVVVDRGWIFAGDVTEESGRIVLTRAVHVRSWSGVGFDGMIADPSKSTMIKPLQYPVDIPRDAEVFRIPVGDSWGL